MLQFLLKMERFSCEHEIYIQDVKYIQDEIKVELSLYITTTGPIQAKLLGPKSLQVTNFQVLKLSSF